VYNQSKINHQPITSDTYVPLISSGVAGPLGVLHLPRMWQKVSLEAKGKLASGYPGIGRGVRRHDLRRPWARGTGGEGLY